ncbi:hypothetical protein VTK56DRAFT_8305 [Thermocarpiscus australiensis]
MALLVDLSFTDWPYYTVPAAFFLIMVPHAYGIILAGKNFDLANPRKTEENCAKDTSLDKTVCTIYKTAQSKDNGSRALVLYDPSRHHSPFLRFRDDSGDRHGAVFRGDGRFTDWTPAAR